MIRKWICECECADLPGICSDCGQEREEYKCPSMDPVTQNKFFMMIHHPQFGWMATYGGPHQSHTLTQTDMGGEFSAEVYDHNIDGWIGARAFPTTKEHMLGILTSADPETSRKAIAEYLIKYEDDLYS